MQPSLPLIPQLLPIFSMHLIINHHQLCLARAQPLTNTQGKPGTTKPLRSVNTANIADRYCEEE
jgi:hypothetical protein